MYKISNTGALVGMKGGVFAPGLTEMPKADFDKLDKEAFQWWVEQGRLVVVEEPKPAPSPAPAPEPKPAAKSTKKRSSKKVAKEESDK